ncbi:MAG: hypothetical protein M1581_01515 [Candidatus Thermoplasmatota archaeon]|jgi:choline kinase|nr:hypothetical protein [Candidatus Thermoplasmatota archaeon]
MVNKEMLDEISAEIYEARQKYGKISSLHEAHSIIMEEFDEFWFDIKNKENLEMTRKELIQVISACMMALEDLF